jgi:hypothetical protein
MSKHYKPTSIHPYSSSAFQQYQEQGGVQWFERSQHDKQNSPQFMPFPLDKAKRGDEHRNST